MSGKRKYLWIASVLMGVTLLLAGVAAAAGAAKGGSVFAKDNLAAWCIVPFDAKNRGPVERAEMLKRLGISMLAYDWRDRHIPEFDQELDALQANGIRLLAFWIPTTMTPATDEKTQFILKFLKRRNVKTQIWITIAHPQDFDSWPQTRKVDEIAKVVSYLAAEGEALGSPIGLYNHGGWFGEPENQLAIIAKVGRKNVGMVYNFHHGHEHLGRFAQIFPKMKPHLLALNLNGMRQEGPKILPLGEGDRELGMLRVVRKSGYRGPIGILNHQENVDAEEGLARNLAGMKKLVAAMNDREALETY